MGMGFKRSVRSSIAVTVCVALIICLLVPGGLTRASTEIIREDILTISAGSGYSLAIKSDGAVWAWGSNDSGQLGNGSMESSAAPVRVSDLTEVTSVSAGYGHSLARKSDGTVRAWGYNVSGQLGNGTKNESRIPVAVSGLNEVLTISAGTFHSLALKENGSVWSWGGNYLGQLGDGTNSAKTTPVQVSSLSDVTGISAGDGHSLALKDGGTVWAWGNNYNGQLGDGTAGGEYDYDAGIDKNTPVQVWGLTGVIAISAGNSHSLALKSDGTVWAWGDNSTGQLGDGTTMDKSLPVRVRGPSNVVNISTGSNFSMALTAGGEIWAWGDNSYGQLGNGCSGGNWEYDRNIDVAIPVKLSSLSEVVAVSAGSSHSLVLKSNGTIWSWGSNTYGQLGQGIMGNKYSPVQVSDLNHISSVKAGNEISLGLKGDGTVWAWGNNLMLETGTLSHSFPKQDSGLTDVNVISTSTHTGENGCLALKNSGAIISTKTVRNWIYDSPAGWNSSLLREQVSGLSGIIDLSMGENHDLFLKDNGTVWARGSNWSGQLGDGTIEYRSSPIQIQNLSNIVSISAGENFSLAVKNNGTGWSWGANWSGQLGDGTRDTRTSPVQVINLSGIVVASTGEYHSLALKNDGTVWSWGANWYGQLGDGTTQDRSSPVKVNNLNNVIAISAGPRHSLALKSDGTIWSWGANWYGQLGDGTTQDRSLPVKVNNLNNVIAISAGSSHSLALKSDGTIWTWGSNWYGELGDGSGFKNIPVSTIMNEVLIPGQDAPSITTTTLQDSTVGTAYSETLAATGTPPISWSVTSGSLPAGLILDEATGVISGTPTNEETANFTIKATNVVGNDTRELSIDIITVAVAPTITTKTLLGGTVGTAYSETLAATGTPPITWSVTSGSLPVGLTLDTYNGIISGTPTNEDTANFTVKATNTAGSDTRELSIDITATQDECFIATAAFGSKFTWPVTLLRDFRDQYLLTNSWGNDFVNFYYNNSPPIATIISNNQTIKPMVRVLLAPLVASVFLLYHPTILLLIMIMVIFITSRFIYRRYLTGN